jgi:hypothetical protein
MTFEMSLLRKINVFKALVEEIMYLFQSKQQ